MCMAMVAMSHQRNLAGSNIKPDLNTDLQSTTLAEVLVSIFDHSKLQVSHCVGDVGGLADTTPYSVLDCARCDSPPERIQSIRCNLQITSRTYPK